MVDRCVKYALRDASGDNFPPTYRVASIQTAIFPSPRFPQMQ
jgi:hypothetical protein